MSLDSKRFSTITTFVPRYGAEDDSENWLVVYEPDFDKLAQVAETIKNALRSSYETVKFTTSLLDQQSDLTC